LRNRTVYKKNPAILAWMIFIIAGSITYGFPSGIGTSELVKPSPADTNNCRMAQGSANVPTSSLNDVFELIYKGGFDEAGKLIEASSAQYEKSYAELLNIIYEYRALQHQRQVTRKAAYQEQLAELEKLRAGAEVNDINDVNGIVKALSVITAAYNFADEQQKQSLLEEPFVKHTIQKALEKAAEFESKGKWLEAYTSCYSWLQSIMPDNKQYSEHAEQLIEKANIVASLQDSPCETRQQRYKNINDKMFIRAIDALHFNYVNIIDYRQMALKALRRCRTLAEVMSLMEQQDTSLASEPSNRNGADETAGASASRQQVYETQKLAAWSAALSALMDEINQSPMGISKDKFINVFEKVLSLNSTTVELPREIVIAQFADAALSALDPYTVMVWPQQVKSFEKTMTNEFTGIGIEISKERGLLTVASLLPGTPAYNSGLDAGDIIEEVDGVPTKDMSLVCAVRRITGPAGTKVTLTVRRPGQKERRKISITRAKITVPTIRGWKRTEAGRWLYMLDEADKIGYVRITSFSGTTANDLEQVLNELESQGLAGLILDLRFNSGGLLDSAVAVVDKFIEEGLIVKTQPRFIPSYATAKKKGTHPNYPLVVLVNQYSASASEIVAGALQDKAYKRAILVGERTHGKGSVQGITSYPGGGAQLKYTMAYYHLPSGQRVKSRDEVKEEGGNDWGIGPDIVVKLRSDELKKMLDVQRQNDVLVRADHDNGSSPLNKHSLEETLEADPQLAVGLLVVKCKLIEEMTKQQHLKTTSTSDLHRSHLLLLRGI